MATQTLPAEPASPSFDPALLCLIAAIVVIVAVESIAFLSTMKAISATGWVARGTGVVSQLRSVANGIQSAEVNQRTFLLTGDPLFMARYRAAKASIDKRVSDLAALIEDDPAQRARVGNLRASISRSLELLETGIQARAARKDVSPFIDAGRLITDSALGTLDEMETDEKLAHRDRTRSLDSGARLSRIMITVGSLLSITLLLGGAWALRRELRRRKLAVAQAALDREAAIRALDARSTFLASMSHEIRTPLNSIIGMSDVLSESALDGEQSKCVTTLVRSSQALLHLIDDILDLSKIEAGKFEVEVTRYDLRELIDQCASIMGYRASSKGLELSYGITPGTPVLLMGDPNRLRQVLLNLIGNSVKFTQKGSVRLEAAEPAAVGDRRILRFDVIDTGIGINAEKREQIFERFNQAEASISRRFGGTGLGLSISRKLVELMGGRISVESAEGLGSVFRVEVPLVPQTEAPIDVVSRARGDDARPLRILVADDIDDNRQLLQMYLKARPYRLHFVETGQQAVRVYPLEAFDLVLLDMHMPVMNGYDAARGIRRIEKDRGLPRVPIIALTAYAMKEEAERCHAAGCDRHVSKPVTKDELTRAIRTTPPPERAGSQPRVEVRKEIESLLPNFLQNRALEVIAIDRAAAEGDLGRVGQLAHSLRGVSGSFGFARLSELASEIEGCVAERDVPGVRRRAELARQHLVAIRIAPV